MYAQIYLPEESIEKILKKRTAFFNVSKSKGTNFEASAST
jgi:hypothetical protein